MAALIGGKPSLAAKDLEVSETTTNDNKMIETYIK
jgi:hypothetical protein